MDELKSFIKRRKNRIGILRWAARYLILFGFLFNINILPSISSTNLCSVLAICVMLTKPEKTKMIFRLYSKKNLAFFCFSMAFCLLLCFFNGIIYTHSNNVEVMRPIYIIGEILYVPIFAAYCLVEYEKIEDFAFVLLSLFMVQAIAVFLAVVDSNVRLYLYDHFYFGDDRFELTIEKGTRIMGIALSQSTGSIKCSVAIAVLCVLKIKKSIKEWLYWLLCIIILLMTMFIGRTGLLVEIILIVFNSIKVDIKSYIYITVSLVLVLFGLQYLLAQIDPSVAEALQTWIFSAFDEEGTTGTLNGINKKLPDFSSELILGTNVLRGHLPYGGEVQSDSGYVKMVCSIGIIGAFIYYYSFYVILYKGTLFTKSKFSKFVKLMVLLAFVIEYKEPYFKVGTFAWIILTISLFILRERVSLNHSLTYNKK